MRERTAALPVEAIGGDAVLNGVGPREIRDAIEAASIVADEGRTGLQRWVEAGRREGLTWSDVGAVLGISKQAAQQRFRSALEPEDAPRPDQIEVRFGATAFNEERILDQEGRRCNELVRVGALALVFRKTDAVWEHRRVVALSAAVAEASLTKARWTYVSSWFPFHYFKRRSGE